MKIFLVTLAALVLTFLIGLIFRKPVKKHPFIAGGYKIHHSVPGLLLFVAGLVWGNSIVMSAGLGIYLAHGFEEMYFNKTRGPQAFFVFVTRPGRKSGL